MLRPFYTHILTLSLVIHIITAMLFTPPIKQRETRHPLDVRVPSFLCCYYAISITQ